jgi:copper oxidase (laccase) domain-containing protein
MDPEDIVDDKTLNVNDDGTGLETGTDNGQGIESGSDLDRKLDEIAGIKSDAKTTPTDKTGKVADDKTTNAAPKKPGEEGYVAPRQEQRTDRQDSGRTYQPRTYPKAYASDAQGNVIIKATGEVIATAGAGRKAFERMLPLIGNATSEAEKYKGLYEAAEKSNVVAANLKLTPDEYSIGARIMAAYKSDPKKAIAFLISEAQNSGVDVSDLGVSGGGGLTAAAIEQILDNKLKTVLEPFNFITADRQQQEQDREATLEADRTVSEFVSAFPDAEIHADSIARIMNTKPGEIDIEKAYWILNAHAAKLGLDWTKPLVPQINAKLGKTPNNDQPANTGRPLPELNGRPHNDSVIERTPRVMGGMSSSSDIVKEAMREAGMNVE